MTSNEMHMKIYKVIYSCAYRKWAVMDNRSKSISQYEDSEYQAMQTCKKFNAEARQGKR